MPSTVIINDPGGACFSPH